MSDINTLQSSLRDLAERVARLEAAQSLPPEPALVGGDEASDTFWALNGLRERLTQHPTTAHGEVMVVGSLTLPTGEPVAWQESVGTAGTLEVDWSERAATLAALGHPVRLEILRHLLTGVRSTADLAELDALGTTGQLHHHLRALVAAGWARQTGRGLYEVPAARIVPLLALIMAADR
ncbi:winged helix-turn-helix transcriptional regulator [Micrococcales bacterium 31B]|nr:winged helix-turn-helix transcriptional regulator [Micrococcales bacterium 31B]